MFDVPICNLLLCYSCIPSYPHCGGLFSSCGLEARLTSSIGGVVFGTLQHVVSSNIHDPVSVCVCVCVCTGLQDFKSFNIMWSSNCPNNSCQEGSFPWRQLSKETITKGDRCQRRNSAGLPILFVLSSVKRLVDILHVR